MFTVTIYPKAAGAAAQPIPNVTAWQRSGSRLLLTIEGTVDAAWLQSDTARPVTFAVPWINLDAIGAVTVWDHDRQDQPLPEDATHLVALVNAQNENACMFFASDLTIGADGRPSWHIPEAAPMQVPWVSLSYLQRVQFAVIDPAEWRVNVTQDEPPAAGPATGE